MDTVNIVLMILLAAMIGFAIGNVWGKETMKKAFTQVISKLTDGLKIAAEQSKKESDK